jgi:hypothetical protein
MADPHTTRTAWTPTQLEELVDGPFDTSMGTAKVKTNATYGFLKAMGNRQGPHALACEYVGTALARWFGLSVAEPAVMRLEEVDCYPLPRGARTAPGPAFISRYVPGHTWGRSTEELDRLENRRDITRLVVFDTWVQNCDRHPPDLETRNPNYANVWLADTDTPNVSRLYAIDHTHCFDRHPELTPRLSEIGRVRDEGVYGLFPEFVPYIDRGELAWCKAMLQSLKEQMVRGVVDGIPPEWDVSKRAGDALVELIVKRAAHLASKIDKGWGVSWWYPPAE